MRTPELLNPTTTERVLLPSGREEALPKATPRFPKWQGEFPWSTYGDKPILDLYGEPLYAEFVILRLLEAQGWRGVWVNHVYRGPFPTRWTPSPIKILPPSNLLDLMDRIYARRGKRSGAFDILAWADEHVLFAEAKHGGKDALRPSQKAWIEAALDEGVPLESLLVVEWGFSRVEAVGDYPEAGVAQRYSVPSAQLSIASLREGMSATPPVNRTQAEAQPLGGSVTINDGKALTSTRRVKLSIRADDPPLGSRVVEMRIKNGGGDPWTEWRKYVAKMDWKLKEGDGQKVVYVQFRDHAGIKSEPTKATITLRPRVGGGGRLGVVEGDVRISRRLGALPYPEERAPDSEARGRLTSEGMVRSFLEDPEVFFDAHDPDAHGKFLRWRERNQRGYVISRRSTGDAMLHRTYCGHFEHGDKSAILTRTMKVCSNNRSDLEGWARENLTARLKRCRSCM